MARPLTIAYVCVEDPADKRSWSGTFHHLAEALRAVGHRVVVVGPLRPQPLLFLCRALNQVLVRLIGKRFHWRDSTIMSKAYARIVERKLKDIPADLIVAPAGLAAIAHLRTVVPIVHVNDRCLAGAVGYHAILTGLVPWSLRDSLRLERKALQRADLTIYASDWASEAARKVMPAVSARIRTIPFGANSQEVLAPEHRDFPNGPLKMLFVGVDWVNKGGPVAVAALRDLGRRGFDAQLVVCGCDVPEGITDANIIREGFLSKNDPRQRMRLEEHLRTADIFILPTRFEAYGIAFCEAAAHGVPALGSRTGGVPTIVLDGTTGFLFDLGDDGSGYAARIEQLVRDPEMWQRMRTAARERYEEHFTWRAFVQRLLAEVEAAGLINALR